MKRPELLIFIGLSLILLFSLAVIIPVEHSSRSSSTGVSKVSFAAQKPLRFHVVGDYGILDGSPPPVQLVAESMANRSNQYPIDFVLTTGDNVYPDGMEDIFDPTQEQLMNVVFNIEGLAGKPWYASLGNHDCNDPTPEIDATELYQIWNLPQPSYNLSVPLDDNSTALFLILDGCTLACELINTNVSLDYCTYPVSQQEINQQYTWLTETLLEASVLNTSWIFVIIHEPPFSAGSGSGDNEALKQVLYPLLLEYKVDFLLTGHEHLMEYLYASGTVPYEPLPNENYPCYNYTSYLGLNQTSVEMVKGNGLHEIVMGASGHSLDTLCPERVTSMADLIFGSTTYGFAEVSLNSQEVTVNYISIESETPIFTVKVIARD